MRFFSTLLIVVLSLSRTAAIAADQIPVVGVWKLVSYERKILETGKIEKTLGEKPTGYLTYTAGKHFSVFVFGADRKRPVGDVPTPEEALMLYRSTSASYAGTYSVEGNKVVHHVDVAWTPAWVGTDQVRYFAIEGPNLTIETAPSKSPFDGLNSVRYLKFERVE